MQVLAYNPVDNSYFIGLSFEEFEIITKKFIIHYDHSSNIEVEKQKALHNASRSEYVKMIKELYNIKKYPFICIETDKKFAIKVLPTHYPFSPLWNGYSPWKRIRSYEIKDFSELNKGSI